VILSHPLQILNEVYRACSQLYTQTTINRTLSVVTITYTTPRLAVPIILDIRVLPNTAVVITAQYLPNPIATNANQYKLRDQLWQDILQRAESYLFTVQNRSTATSLVKFIVLQELFYWTNQPIINKNHLSFYIENIKDAFETYYAQDKSFCSQF
jgi:hypothetical protein